MLAFEQWLDVLKMHSAKRMQSNKQSLHALLAVDAKRYVITLKLACEK